MRSSDWSSDVCSSDLEHPVLPPAAIGRVWVPVAVQTLYGRDYPGIGGCGRRFGNGLAVPERPPVARRLQQYAANVRLGPELLVDRQRVEWGKSGSERVDVGGSLIHKQKKKKSQ